MIVDRESKRFHYVLNRRCSGQSHSPAGSRYPHGQGVRRGNQREPSREDGRPDRARQDDPTVLERLTHGLDGVAPGEGNSVTRRGTARRGARGFVNVAGRAIGWTAGLR